MTYELRPDLRGPAIVVRGSVLNGFTFTGPFETLDAAYHWMLEHTVEGRLGVAYNTICLLEKPRTDVLS